MRSRMAFGQASASLWSTLLCLSTISPALGSRFSHKFHKSPVDTIQYLEDQSPVVSWPQPRVHATNEGDHLKVCDCEMASISKHGGLLCDKEGYFITSFEAVGHWINGGGRVPLSRAKCCRLCIPDELSPKAQAALPDDAKPWGVISVGCHASTSESKVSCESSPTSTFATGFQRDVLVPSLAAATFYPEGPMTCCSPALMLSNGDAWQIERCACEWSSTTGCSSMGDDYILWGFAVYRDGGSGAHVPVAPAQCCQACLGTQMHPMDKCLSLNRCSRRGVCILGACSCDQGWGGPDCSQELKHKSWPPKWLMYSLMLGSMVVSMALWVASRQLLANYVDRRRIAAEENQAMLDPLLVSEGEVGDEDTTDDETDDEGGTPAAGPRISLHTPLLQAEGTPEDGRPEADETGYGGTGTTTVEVPAMATDQEQPPQGEAAAGGAEEEKGALQIAAVGGAGEAEEEDEELAAEVARKFDEKVSPLAQVKCSICFDRPVQVALVPCGHSNLCRHCARRLEHCPYCRKPVVRRQRLYLADS